MHLFQKKKVKISNVKRSHHLKNKKNFTKPLKKKEVATPAKKPSTETGKKGGGVTSHKVFGKPPAEKSNKRNKRIAKGALLPPPPPPPKPLSKKKQTNHEVSDESEEEYNVQDMIDMIDDDHASDYRPAKVKKRKHAEEEDDEDQSAKHFEKEYAQLTNSQNQNKKRMVSLLPIKTKGGEVVTRETEVDEDEEGLEPEDELEPEDGEADEEEVDSDDDVVRGEAVSYQYA